MSTSTFLGSFTFLHFHLILQQRDRAPEFGKWESDVRYTAYFEKAGKSNASSSSSKPVSPPVNAGRIHIGSGTRATQDTAMVRQRHRELLEAAELQHPLRTERQTRAEVGNHWRMATNPSHPRHQAPYQGVGVDALVHEIRSNPSRPRAGGGEGYPPPRVRNSSSESGGRAGIMPPLAPERSRPRPAGYPPPRDRNSSSESGGKAANMPPLAPERSRLRPLAERDRTVTNFLLPYYSIDRLMSKDSVFLVLAVCFPEGLSVKPRLRLGNGIGNKT